MFGSAAQQSVNYVLEIGEYVPSYQGYLAKIVEFRHNAPSTLKAALNIIDLHNTTQSLHQLMESQQEHKFLPFIIVSKAKLPGQHGTPGQKIGVKGLQPVGMSGVKVLDEHVVLMN